MDATLRAQFVEALRTDERFRGEVRRELVGEQLLSLLRSATDMAARDVAKLPDDRSTIEDIGRTVGVLVDVLAVQRRDLDTLLQRDGAPGPDATSGAILRKVASGLEDLASALSTLESRVDVVASETDRQSDQLSRLMASTSQFIPLAGAGFSAVQDALNGMLAQQRATQELVESMSQPRSELVVDLRDDAYSDTPGSDPTASEQPAAVAAGAATGGESGPGSGSVRSRRLRIGWRTDRTAAKGASGTD